MGREPQAVVVFLVGVSGPGRRRLQANVASLSVDAVLDGCPDNKVGYVSQRQKLGQPVRGEVICDNQLGYAGWQQTFRQRILRRNVSMTRLSRLRLVSRDSGAGSLVPTRTPS